MKISTKEIVFLFLCGLVSINSGQPKELDYKQRNNDKSINTINNLPLIIITSPLELTFPDNERFTGTNKIEIKGADSFYEYRLFVAVEEKAILVKVASKGFDELQIEVEELGPKIVKRYHVFEKITSKVNVDLGELYLATEPEGAKITIYGIPDFKGETPFLFSNYTAKAYQIVLEKEDYYKVDTIITIVKNNAERLNVKLRAKFGILKLVTDMENKLYVDGIEKDFDNSIRLTEGEHNIIVKRKYFKDYNEKLEVVGLYDPMVIERNVELEPWKGILNIESTPQGATVYLDGDNIGETPLRKTIDAGDYRIELKKDNYRTESDIIEIKKDEIIEKLYDLKKYGLLKIEGAYYTQITINGSYKGTLPSANYFELPPGHYEVKAELEGYDSEVYSFYLETETKILEINLTETEGRSFRLAAFGNERLSQVTPKWNLYGALNIQTINPSLLSTAVQYPLYYSIKNRASLGGGINLTFLPFLFEADMLVDLWIKSRDVAGSERITLASDSTLFKMYFYRVKVGICPFVLFERIYPFFGIVSQTVSVDVQTGSLLKNISLNSKSLNYQEFGLFTNVTFRLSNKFVFVIGYEKYNKKDAFDDGFYTHIGLYL